MKRIINKIFDILSVVWALGVALIFAFDASQNAITREDWIFVGIALLTIAELIHRKK